MPNSGLRALTLADVLAEAPPDHHTWIRAVTEDVFERQLRELRERVDEIDDDDQAAGNLRQLAVVAAAAASIREQLAAAG